MIMILGSSFPAISNGSSGTAGFRALNMMMMMMMMMMMIMTMSRRRKRRRTTG